MNRVSRQVEPLGSQLTFYTALTFFNMQSDCVDSTHDQLMKVDSLQKQLNEDKKRLKKLLATDEISREDYDAIDIGKLVRFKKQEAEKRFLQRDNVIHLRRQEPAYHAWKAKQRREELDNK